MVNQKNLIFGREYSTGQCKPFNYNKGAMDDTTIAGTASVSNGIFPRMKNSVYDNIGNAKKNGDFKARGRKLVYAEKVGGGEFSLQSICEFCGYGNTGVVIRLDGSLNEATEAIVQDDLRAITQISDVVIGHVVED